MTAINQNILSSMLLEDSALRLVEPGIYSVLPDNEAGNEYDSQFGYIYDLVACNALYNRIIWGYSVKIYPQIAGEALRSSRDGAFLDLGCGSLAFTAGTYSQHKERPIVLVDQSLKMLRMAKTKLIKQNGDIPENIVFLHANALQLPFQENTFTTILSQNLLHCLNDTGILLKQLKSIRSESGHMYFTTLVRAGRFADQYLEALADNGKLVSRSIADHKKVFDYTELSAEFETTGNILVIKGI